jgi:hypothetical protein
MPHNNATNGADRLGSDTSVYITTEQFHAADSVTQTYINNVFH